MASLIACGKTIDFLDFPSFDVKSTYGRGDDFDFQFVSTNLFAKSQKNVGFELLQIKSDEIKPVCKIREKNISCIACTKSESQVVAAGLATGHIRIINYKTATNVKTFTPEVVNESVIFLDYSACSNYIACVGENFIIRIFGLQTSSKLDNIKLDKQTTLARFHPVKRFHLAAASFRGAVHVQDIQAKRTVYKCLDAHNAPCRDLCMSEQHPDLLFSVGFDKIVNIFDTRKKSTMHQIESNYPFSAISASDCGNYFSVGNLKGEIIGYDIRNLSNILNIKKIYDSSVQRIAFVPEFNLEEITDTSGDNTANVNIVDQSTPKSEIEINKSSNSNRLSTGFFDEVLLHSQKQFKDFPSSDYVSRVCTKTNDDNKANSRYSSDSRLSTCSRLSTGSRISLNLRQNSFYKCLDDSDMDYNRKTHTENANFEANEKKSSSCDDLSNFSYVNTDRLIKRNKTLDGANKKDDHTKKFSRKSAVDLEDINEENVSYVATPASPSKFENNKENINSNINSKSYDNNDAEFNLKLAVENVSTPKLTKNSSKKDSLSGSASKSTPAELNGTQNNSQLKELLNEIQLLRSTINDKMKLQDDKLQSLEEKMKLLLFDVTFNSDRVIFKLQTSNLNIFNEQEKDLNVIKSALECLSHSDPFILEYIKIRTENDELKKQLLKLRRKN